MLAVTVLCFAVSTTVLQTVHSIKLGPEVPVWPPDSEGWPVPESGQSPYPFTKERSYELTGLTCFPDGLRLPCDCEEHYYCPCCRDYKSGECYRPAFFRWSEWLPCTLCNDDCTSDEECRIMYEEIAEPSRPVRDVSAEFSYRVRRDVPLMGLDVPIHLSGLPSNNYDYKHWDKGSEKYRCKVLRYECRDRPQHYWGNWTELGECSSNCSQGIQYQYRFCYNGNGTIDDDDLCEGGADAAVRHVPCNVHLCQELSGWELLQPCGEVNGACSKMEFRECIFDGPEPDVPLDCLHRMVPCQINSCIEAEYIFNWTSCNSSCSPGWREGTGTCYSTVDGEKSDKCEDGMYTTEFERCNEDLCPEYSDWVPEGDCPVECGPGELFWTRTCKVDIDADIPIDCRWKILPCDAGDCPNCSLVSRGPMSDCNETCEPGVHDVLYECEHLETGEPCDECVPLTFVFVEPCNTDLCLEYSDFTAVTDCSAECGTGSQQLSRECIDTGGMKLSLPAECLTKEEPCNTERCTHLGDFGDYSACSEDCEIGDKTKVKQCLYTDTGEEAPAELCELVVETAPCNTHLCGGYGGFTLSDCTYGIAECGVFSQVEQRECLDDGEVPEGCDTGTATPCDGSAQTVYAFDLYIMYDSSVASGTAADGSVCTLNKMYDHTDPDLANFPVWKRQQKFMTDFHCALNEVSMSETRLGLLAGKNCGSDVIVRTLDDTTDLQTSIDEAIFHCKITDISANFFCPVSLGFQNMDLYGAEQGARDGHFDVFLYILLSEIGAGETYSAFTSFVASFMKNFVIVAAKEDYASDSDYMDGVAKIACLDKDATAAAMAGDPCMDRFLGGMYDDIHAVVENLYLAAGSFTPV